MPDGSGKAASAEIGPAGVAKVVLAYSGGLDTSVILRWLQDHYRCEVVTFTADLGQGEELEPARAKAEMMGCATTSSRCFAPMPSTRARIYWAPRSPGR
jgi:hypothetical protein